MTTAKFNLAYRNSVHADVRERFPNIRLMKDAWVIRTTFGQWEFHGPDNFYTHFRAEDAYDARAKGWEEWLATQSPKQNKGRTK